MSSDTSASIHPAPRLNAALWGSVLALVAVALGAFGAHALKGILSAPMLTIYETGVRYQMYAGLGLLALGAYPQQRRAPLWILAGSVLFSLSLYLLAFTGVGILGAITPIGGVLMLVGWVMAALDFKTAKR